MYGLIFCYPTLCKELKIEEAISFSRQFLLSMFLFLREFLLLTKWNEQRSSIPWDKRGAWSPKSFFLPFGPQVGLKIKGGWAPRPLSWIRHHQVKSKLGTFYPFILKAGSKYTYITLALKDKQTNKRHSFHLGVLTQWRSQGNSPVCLFINYAHCGRE